MTGRWAYLSDSADACAAALQRLTLTLDTAGTGPQSVALLPDRSSQILGAAAAAMLSLPAADFDPAQPAANSIVVAYDLTKTDQDTVAALRQRTPGQIVFERATCWTSPPRITADISGLLSQTIIPPWAAQPRRLHDGTAGQGPADDRPIQAIAAEIIHATPEQDEGDGSAPPDPDQDLRHFVGNGHGPRRTRTRRRLARRHPRIHPRRRPGTQQPLHLNARPGHHSRPHLRSRSDEHHSGEVPHRVGSAAGDELPVAGWIRGAVPAAAASTGIKRHSRYQLSGWRVPDLRYRRAGHPAGPRLLTGATSIAIPLRSLQQVNRLLGAPETIPEPSSPAGSPLDDRPRLG